MDSESNLVDVLPEDLQWPNSGLGPDPGLARTLGIRHLESGGLGWYYRIPYQAASRSANVLCPTD